MSSDNVVIDVQGLSKCYEIYASPRDRLKQLVIPALFRMINRVARGFGCIRISSQIQNYYREFWALHDICFQVKRGETLGIIGRNGSGKSTLLQILAGTLASTCGEIKVNGRIAALLELGSGFNPEFTGRENVYLNCRILGLSQKEIEARFEQIVEFADIGDFIDQPVKTYSSGMFVRLAFAVQAHIDASIVIIDEALAVGDVFFRQKCYARLAQLRNSGAAILLVSHSMGDIEQHCDRAILLDHGKMIRNSVAGETIKEYYLLEQSSRLSSIVTNNQLNIKDDEIALLFPEEASFPLDRASQVNTLNARCLRVALTDVTGEPRRSFRVGETAVFHHEYYSGNCSGIPVGGVILHTEQGVILHGKSSIQTRMKKELPFSPDSIIRFEHRVVLMIAPGEYTFDVGFSVINYETLQSLENLTHQEVDQLKIKLVQAIRVASFSVHNTGKDLAQLSSFHGLVDLPTEIRASVSAVVTDKTESATKVQ